ncbi:MAG: efflux RND transporter periplasmic adaptor subunit, partial [Polaromonas sp.]|nr:efflux RND transporter periplasmic adaptor subunit [Polaromonas sp.]
VVAAGAPVLRIAADGVRDVVFSVPEDKVAAIKVGMPVAVRVWAGNADLQGTVREVAASSDPVTRTYLVKVSLAGKAPPLGATVYVTVDGDAAGALPIIKLPTSALRRDGQATTVWVLDEAGMTVRPQVIEVATADGNEVVVASGLAPGMRVVSAGVHVLSPGQKVSIYQSNMPNVQAGQAPIAPDSVAGQARVPPAASASGAK